MYRKDLFHSRPLKHSHTQLSKSLWSKSSLPVWKVDRSMYLKKLTLSKMHASVFGSQGMHKELRNSQGRQRIVREKSRRKYNFHYEMNVTGFIYFCVPHVQLESPSDLDLQTLNQKKFLGAGRTSQVRVITII